MHIEPFSSRNHCFCFTLAFIFSSFFLIVLNVTVLKSSLIFMPYMLGGNSKCKDNFSGFGAFKFSSLRLLPCCSRSTRHKRRQKTKNQRKRKANQTIRHLAQTAISAVHGEWQAETSYQALKHVHRRYATSCYSCSIFYLHAKHIYYEMYHKYIQQNVSQ